MRGRELFLPAILVAMILIFPAFGTFPYAYYQFLRWVACVTAVILFVMCAALFDRSLKRW
jgi:hypothetical protein